jgi:c-di-GMP-binding flagellar brake protein YcgR
MGLQALVFCSDERIVRVLRRVLADLEITPEHCADTDTAIKRLTRQRFEAVIVDCTDEKSASQVLRSARSAPCNRRAIAVAIINGQTGVRSAFDLGAHFVLYQPISTERAKSSFRAARALMKRERRRNSRTPVEMPVTLFFGDDSSAQQRTNSIDLSEGGMALKLASTPARPGPMRVHFKLPGSPSALDCVVQVAWQNAGRQTGIRFVDIAPEIRSELKAWLNRNSPDQEQDDPPVSCKLTDLSLGGCYVELPAPFPARTRVVLSMRISDLEVKADGVVRVMHPDVGMGVEFSQKTAQQREHVEKFIQALMKGHGALPELLVEPEGLEVEEEPVAAQCAEDPLVELFRRKSGLTSEAFQIELKRQRHSGEETTSAPLSY